MKKMSKESAELFNSVRGFLTDYLPSQKGVSPNTVRSYKMTLTQVLDFAKNARGFGSLSKLSWNDVTRETVESFLSDGEEKRGWSPSTRNQRLTAIKSFLKYASERDITVAALYREVCLIPLKKCGEKPVEFFSENALKAILAEPDVSTRKGMRDLTLMIVLYDTGARVQELLDLRIGDLNNLDGKDPSVRLTGKGRKTRVTPIMDGTAKRIRDYLVMFHKGSSDDDFLFYVMRKGENYTHNEKTQMSHDNVTKLINEYARRAREKCPEVPGHIYPHMFRHSRAMHLYRNGMALPLVSEFLGHASMETTIAFYANADIQMKRDGIAKATSGLDALLDSESDFVLSDDEETFKRLYGLI